MPRAAAIALSIQVLAQHASPKVPRDLHQQTRSALHELELLSAATLRLLRLER